MIEGYGLGLRTDHYRDFVDAPQPVDWLEILSENYMVPGGKPLHFLDRIRADYPMVCMAGPASARDIPRPHFRRRGRRCYSGGRVVADHRADRVDHANLHDLLPLPLTEEALRHVAERVQRVQDFLGRRILLENVSTYVACADDEMTEWDFIAELSARADCWLLLDVNNVYVSARNHGFEARTYLDAMPAARVKQIHLAGHEDHGGYVIDTHDHPIRDEVFELYAYTVERLGPVPTMIERDDNIPPLGVLLEELAAVRRCAEAARRAGGCPHERAPCILAHASSARRRVSAAPGGHGAPGRCASAVRHAYRRGPSPRCNEPSLIGRWGSTPFDACAGRPQRASAHAASPGRETRKTRAEEAGPPPQPARDRTPEGARCRTCTPPTRRAAGPPARGSGARPRGGSPSRGRPEPRGAGEPTLPPSTIGRTEDTPPSRHRTQPWGAAILPPFRARSPPRRGRVRRLAGASWPPGESAPPLDRRRASAALRVADGCCRAVPFTHEINPSKGDGGVSPTPPGGGIRWISAAGIRAGLARVPP